MDAMDYKTTKIMSTIRENIKKKFDHQDHIAAFKQMLTVPLVVKNDQAFSRQKSYQLFQTRKVPDLPDNQLQSIKALCKPIRTSDNLNRVQSVAQANQNAYVYFKRYRIPKHLYSHDFWSDKYHAKAIDKSGLKLVGNVIREQMKQNSTSMARKKFSNYLKQKLQENIKRVKSDHQIKTKDFTHYMKKIFNDEESDRKLKYFSRQSKFVQQQNLKGIKEINDVKEELRNSSQKQKQNKVNQQQKIIEQTRGKLTSMRIDNVRERKQLERKIQKYIVNFNNQ